MYIQIHFGIVRKRKEKSNEAHTILGLRSVLPLDQESLEARKTISLVISV